MQKEESNKASKNNQRHSVSIPSSLEETSTIPQRILGKFLGLKKLKKFKIKMYFGMNASQDYDKEFIRNLISTTK